MIYKSVLAIALMLSLSQVGFGDVIDFESLRIDDSDAHDVTSPYSEDGFQITSTSGGLRFWGTQADLFAGSTGLFSFATFDVVTLSSVGSTEFDFTTINIDQLVDPPPNNEITFTGFKSDGSSVMETVTVDFVRGYETFNFSTFTNLVNVQWSGRNIQFDDITVQLIEMESVTPSAYTTFRGVNQSGGVAEISASDDTYLKHNPGFVLNNSEAPVWLVFDSNLLNDSPSSLDLAIEASANTPGISQTTEAFNWNTMNYEVVDVQGSSFNTDAVISVDLSSSVGDYVESGTGALRTRGGWRKTGFTIVFPWTICVDQVEWNAGS